MDIQPLGNKILVKEPEEDKSEKKTEAGIVLPNQTNQKDHIVIEAIGVGPNVESVKKGDKILFNAKVGAKFEVGGTFYRSLPEDSVIAVIKE
jgi:chaperonin GroES